MEFATLGEDLELPLIYISDRDIPLYKTFG